MRIIRTCLGSTILLGLCAFAHAGETIAVVDQIPFPSGKEKTLRRDVEAEVLAAISRAGARGLSGPQMRACTNTKCMEDPAAVAGATRILLVKGTRSSLGYDISVEFWTIGDVFGRRTSAGQCSPCGGEEAVKIAGHLTEDLVAKVLRDEPAPSPADPGLAPVTQVSEIVVGWRPDAPTATPRTTLPRSQLVGRGVLIAGTVAAVLGTTLLVMDGQGRSCGSGGRCQSRRNAPGGGPVLVGGLVMAAIGGALVVFGGEF